MAKEKGTLFADRLSQMDMSLLTGNTHTQWMKIKGEIDSSIKSFNKVSNLTDARTFFASLSDQMTDLIKHFGIDVEKDIYLIHCPMARENQGAFWLQDSPDVNNPYFGSSMLKCHDSKEIIVSKKNK
jgi:Cu(I)/Ag(I) efflux system membrane fusion protein